MRINKNRYLKQWLLLMSYLIVFCLAFGGTMIFLQKYDVRITPKKSSSGIKMCVMDAKQCPDGSYVSRLGPNCEFAECPTTNNQGMDNKKVDSFETCAAAGYPILESYPRKCTTPEGMSYTEEGSQTDPVVPGGM